MVEERQTWNVLLLGIEHKNKGAPHIKLKIKRKKHFLMGKYFWSLIPESEKEKKWLQGGTMKKKREAAKDKTKKKKKGNN